MALGKLEWYSDNTPITLETTASYITQTTDVGKQVTYRVTANNAGGSTTAISNAIIPVASMIVNNIDFNLNSGSNGTGGGEFSLTTPLDYPNNKLIVFVNMYTSIDDYDNIGRSNNDL
jgi:hypothetical protein